MTAAEEDVMLCVLLQAAKNCDYKRNPLFLRLAVNGVLQADIISKRIAGLDGMFVVMVRLPGGVKNIAILQMGTSKNEHMAQIAPNNHIVDIESHTLFLMTWGKQLQKLPLSPGKQLMFILPDVGKDRLAVQGSIRPLSCWKDALDLYSVHIPNTATLLALPVQQRKKSIAFKLVRLPTNASGWSDGMEWEQPLHKNKTVSLSELTDGDIIVSRLNDSSVHKTEVNLSVRGYKVNNADTVMQSIFESTSDMYKCINDIPIEDDEEETKKSEDKGAAKSSDKGGKVKQTGDDDNAKKQDDVKSTANGPQRAVAVSKDVEEDKSAILDVLQASDVGDILSFACSCETIATTVNQDSLSTQNDVAPMLDDKDLDQDGVRAFSLHGDTAQKAANEAPGGPMSSAADEGTLAKDTMLPTVSSTMSAPGNKVYTSVSRYNAAIMPSSQSTDASTDPGGVVPVKRKKTRRFKKIANTKVMMWLMHKH